MTDRVSDAFVELALDRSGSLPVDTPVRLYFGNVYAKTVPARVSGNPDAYELCGSYAGHDCPMSALTVVRAYGPTGTRLGDVTDSCLVRRGPTPHDTGGTHVVTLRPATRVPCRKDFAVQLSVNDVGQITAVNLLLGRTL